MLCCVISNTKIKKEYTKQKVKCTHIIIVGDKLCHNNFIILGTAVGLNKKKLKSI